MGRRAGENIDVFIFVVKLINGIFGPAMSLLMLFGGEVPRRWRELKAEGLEVRSLAEGLPEIGANSSLSQAAGNWLRGCALPTCLRRRRRSFSAT